MQVIALQAVPSQSVSCSLGGQSCKIVTYQKSTGFYLDLYVDDTLIIGGVLCWIAVEIVRSAYLGFTGDLVFYDLQVGSAPLLATSEVGAVEYSGLGDRYFLAYIT